MALVNMQAWLAQRGIQRGMPAEAPEPSVEEQIAFLTEQVALRDETIQYQTALIEDLQRALSTFVERDRQAALAQAVRPRTARVIRRPRVGTERKE